MGVNHGGGDVTMAEQFLNGANIVAAFEKMGGEAMAKGMATGGLSEAGGGDRAFDGVLKVLF